ncbi:MAG: glycosyltransferase [Nanoarchaeota archaeon]|nr:glycosyltransferase [Nanoarchaeota archaeon]
MNKISLCMIVKDEETCIETCIDSVKEFVDEAIIVDTGSTDRTKEIAKRYTKKVFDYKWEEDFAKARNRSIGYATGDWILILDADEVIAKEDIKKLKETIEKTDASAILLIQRDYSQNMARPNWVPINDVPRYKESKGYNGYSRTPTIRLFRNNLGIFFQGVIHETVTQSIKEKGLSIERVETPIHHYVEEKRINTLADRQLRYLELAEKTLLHKEDGRLYYKAAAVYMHFKKDHGKALEYLEKASHLGYEKNKSSEGMALCHIALGQYNAAYEIYKKLVVSGYVSISLCNNLANILVMHKEHKAALKYLKKALELGHPNKEKITKNIEAIEKYLNSDIKKEK